jgi:hypothetical protein
MTPETLNTVLLFLGAVVVAVLFLFDRMGKRLNESIPADLMPLFLGLLALAESLAKNTPTTADDELIARVRAALEPPTPPAQPTVTELVEDTGAQG